MNKQRIPDPPQKAMKRTRKIIKQTKKAKIPDPPHKAIERRTNK